MEIQNLINLYEKNKNKFTKLLLLVLASEGGTNSSAIGFSFEYSSCNSLMSRLKSPPPLDRWLFWLYNPWSSDITIVPPFCFGWSWPFDADIDPADDTTESWLADSTTTMVSFFLSFFPSCTCLTLSKILTLDWSINENSRKLSWNWNSFHWCRTKRNWRWIRRKRNEIN